MKHLPKIELHCHLDGSVRPSTVLDIASEENIPLPTYDVEMIRNFMVVGLDCSSLDEYLKSFEMPITVMQSSSSLERVSYELLEDAANENVKYIEVRFAPHLHTAKRLSVKAVIESVLAGMRRGQAEFDIKANLILSGLRSFPLELIYELIEVGKDFIGRGVVAVDLCAVESEGFSKRYEDAFKRARDYGYRVTIHAGEACSGTNVLEAIKILGAERIGHGVHIASDKDAIDVVKKSKVLLEMCPTSNVQTKAVNSHAAHPIMDFMRSGLKVSISTDNRTVSDTTMTNEVEIVSDTLGMNLDEYRQIYLDSVDASFADSLTKSQLRQRIIDLDK